MFFSLVYLSCSLVFSLMNAQNFSYISNFSLMSIDGYSSELVDEKWQYTFSKNQFQPCLCVCADKFSEFEEVNKLFPDHSVGSIIRKFVYLCKFTESIDFPKWCIFSIFYNTPILNKSCHFQFASNSIWHCLYPGKFYGGEERTEFHYGGYLSKHEISEVTLGSLPSNGGDMPWNTRR